MATTSFTTLRRLSGVAFTLMLFALCLPGPAMGQSTPLVTATSAVGLSHPSGWGTIWGTAIDSFGDWFVVDSSNGALYEFPAGGGPAVTLAATGATPSLGSGNNPGIIIDPGNNIYLEANWNNCMIMFPYAGNGIWTGLNDGGSQDLSPSNTNTTICTNSGSGNEPWVFAQYGLNDSTGLEGGWYQPWAMSLGSNDNLIWGTNNGGAGIAIESLSVNGAWSSPTPNTFNWIPLVNMTARADWIAQDPEGNAYFIEDTGGIPGVLQLLGTSTSGQYQNDCPVFANGKSNAPTSSSCFTRVDPDLPAPQGVITDPQGNLYISDKTEGVWMVPNPSGTPQPGSAVLLSPIPATGEAALDWGRNFLYFPTSQTQNNGEADVVKVGLGYAELGSSAIGTVTPTGSNVVFNFNGSVTPMRAVILENGQTSQDFAISGGTCAMGTAYIAGGNCLETVAMTPHSVGSVSGTLLLQQVLPVPSGQAGASASVTAWSYNGQGTLTITAANSFVAGQPITFSGAASTSPLAPLNSQQLAVLPAGLSSSSFEISTSAVTTSCTSSCQTASVTGEQYSTVGSMLLHGTGVGALVQTLPALESTVGGSLITPSQVAVDSLGNVYVADAGQPHVLEYPAGSGAGATPSAIGSNLASPTGVAVDGAGDIFIADSGTGTVYEIPAVASLSAAQGQVTLITGLGSNLRLAADSLGDLYVADPENKRVVKLRDFNATGPMPQSETMLTAGFTAPTAVAVDSNANLYVIDGNNLFEMAGGFGAPVTLMNNLSGATGVAVDPSGAVYITTAGGGSSRIANVGGTLATGSPSPIASDVSNATSVTIDNLGNVYLTDGSKLDVDVVQVNGSLPFAAFSAPDQSASLEATVVNAGNGPLTVTGYSATNPTIDTVGVTDWTAADGTCIGSSPIAPGATCQVDVTLDPGPGEQGPLSSQISLISTSQNAPVIYATGTAASLTSSTTSATVAGTSQVVNTSVTVTITPTSTSGTPPAPTGTVALTYPTWMVQVPSPCGNAGQPDCVPTVFPETQTVTATLQSGQATFTLAPVLAGTDNFSVEYIGDQVYGRSTYTATGAVAKSAITGIAIPTFPDPTDVDLPFVVASTGNGTTPYSGETPFQYNFVIKVNTAAGVPTGTITVMDNVTSCPPGTSTTGVGAAYCNLPEYSTTGGYAGVACPNDSGAGVINVANTGTATGGQVSFPTSCLWFVPQGINYSPVQYTHYIYPVYSGDANFLGLTGSTSTLLQSIRGPVVQITQSSNSASQTVAPTLTVQTGSSASINLTLTSMLGYGAAAYGSTLNGTNYPLSLSCDNLPPHTQCAFTYPTPDPNVANALDINCPTDTQNDLTNLANGTESCTPGQVTLTIYTNVSAGTTTSQNNLATPVTLAAIFGFGMIGLFFRRKAFEKGRMMLMVLLMVVGGSLAVSLTACNTTALSSGAVLTTPSGTYPMTVTADEVGTICSPQPGGTSDNCIVPGSGSTTYNGILAYGSGNQVSLPFYINVTIQ